MVQQDRVIYDDRQVLVRSNAVGRIAANCAVGSVAALLARLWLGGIEMMTVLIEVFAIVLAAMAAILGARGLALAARRNLVRGAAATALLVGTANLAMILLVSFVLKPASSRTQDAGRCRENLELIGGAAAEYASRHGGDRLAPALADLIAMEPANGLNAKRLACPLDPDAPDRNTRGLYCSYTWIPNQPWGDGAHVAAFCRGGRHEGGTEALMADGRVVFLSQEKLAEALRRTRAAIEAAGRPWAPSQPTPIDEPAPSTP